MITLEELQKICEPLPDDVKTIISPILDDIRFESELLDMYKQDERTKKSPSMQKAYRQTMQTFQQNIKIVLWQLRNNETSSADELLNRLKEFE